MKAIPLELQKRFENYLLKNDIPEKFKGEYKKWLQYYMDFCRKYKFSPEYQESLPPFILKLAEKGQTKAQQDRAYNAISIYYQIIKEKATYDKTKSLKPESSKKHLASKGTKLYKVHEDKLLLVEDKKDESGYSGDSSISMKAWTSPPHVKTSRKKHDYSAKPSGMLKVQACLCG